MASAGLEGSASGAMATVALRWSEGREGGSISAPATLRMHCTAGAGLTTQTRRGQEDDGVGTHGILTVFEGPNAFAASPTSVPYQPSSHLQKPSKQVPWPLSVRAVKVGGWRLGDGPAH